MKKLLMVIVAFCLLAQCTDEEVLPVSGFQSQFLVVTSTSVLTNVKSSACSTCTYVATGKPGQIDGAKLGVKPGDVICLDAAILYGPLTFINMTGTALNPIKIATCGGKVTIQAAGKSFALRVTNSKFFKITGGTSGYNLLLAGGNQGLTLDFKTTEFEVDHLEVANSGFSGIMAKTDPSCDITTQRDNFTMRNVSIHDNYIHHSGGEGIYVGNSFYSGGVTNATCGKIYPHAINGVKIFKNKVQYTGWDGIQLGSAIAGAQVYNNSVEFYGTKNISNQNSGIQLGEGTGGLCYNNSVKTGSGNGIVVLGLGDNKLDNNIIISPGVSGIFCDERYTPGSGFSFTQNIIINPPQDGIQLYAEKVAMNYAVRNVVVNPGNYNKFATDNTWLTGDDAYLHRLCQTLKVTKTSNVFKRTPAEVQEVYNLAFQYNPITSTSNPTSKIPALVTTLGL